MRCGFSTKILLRVERVGPFLLTLVGKVGLLVSVAVVLIEKIPGLLEARELG